MEYVRKVKLLTSRCDCLLVCFEDSREQFGKRLFLEKIKSTGVPSFNLPCYDYYLYQINEKKDILDFMSCYNTIKELFFEQRIYALFYVKNDKCIAYALESEKELIDISKTGDGSAS